MPWGSGMGPGDRRQLSDRQLQEQLIRLAGEDGEQLPRDDPMVVLTLTGEGGGVRGKGRRAFPTGYRAGELRAGELRAGELRVSQGEIRVRPGSVQHGSGALLQACMSYYALMYRPEGTDAYSMYSK